jgi:hypothetical protein
MRNSYVHLLSLITLSSSCIPSSSANDVVNKSYELHDTTYKTFHILTALCDNTYQGIVPAPNAIGNGQDANNNLY